MGYVFPNPPPRGTPAYEAWRAHLLRVGASYGIRPDGSVTPYGRSLQVVWSVVVGIGIAAILALAGAAIWVGLH